MLGLVLVPATLAGARASFSATTSNPGNVLSTAQLQPPSGLSVTQSCTTTPAITRRGYSGASATAGATSVTITPPANTAAGDILVAQIAYRDAVETITTSSGWTQVGTMSNGTVLTSAIYWKVAVAGEPSATFSRPAGSSGDMGGSIIGYIGARASLPTPYGSNTGVGLTATTPSLTTTATTTEVVHFLSKRQDALPTPSGTSGIYSGTTTTGPAGVGMTAADEAFPGPGSTTVRSSTSTTSTSSEWIAQSIVLQRSPGTPTANLSWTASPSSWASGYLLDRQVGGSTQSTATITGVSTTSTTDGGLANGTSYTYVLRTYRSSWRSSSVTVGLTTNC